MIQVEIAKADENAEQLIEAALKGEVILFLRDGEPVVRMAKVKKSPRRPKRSK